MDKREKVLSMGYLVKSPTKNREKANFSKFWKLRWCVFVEIVYKDEYREDKKLVLYYYKNKESHQKDEAAKGHINITSCGTIKSCYQSQSGFDHIFAIEHEGTFVKFSAPTCQKKFKWITMLLNHKQNASLNQPTHPSQGGVQRKRSTGRMNHRMSGCFEEMISLQNRIENKDNTRRMSTNQPPNAQYATVQKTFRRDSNPLTNIYDVHQQDTPPPLPPRRDTGNGDAISVLEDQISICSKFSDDLEMQTISPSSHTKPRSQSIKEEDKEFGMLQIFNDLFMLCEKCQSDSGIKKSTLRRRSSSKKKKKNCRLEDEHEEIDYISTVAMASDSDNVSHDTTSSGESVLTEQDDQYSEINEEFLQKFREKVASISSGTSDNKRKESFSKGDAIKEEVTDKANDTKQHEHDDNNNDNEEDFIYEDMRCIQKNPQSSTTELDGTIPVSEQGVDTAVNEEIKETTDGFGVVNHNEEENQKDDATNGENAEGFYENMDNLKPKVAGLLEKETHFSMKGKSNASMIANKGKEVDASENDIHPLQGIQEKGAVENHEEINLTSKETKKAQDSQKQASDSTAASKEDTKQWKEKIVFQLTV